MSRTEGKFFAIQSCFSSRFWGPREWFVQIKVRGFITCIWRNFVVLFSCKYLCFYSLWYLTILKLFSVFFTRWWGWWAYVAFIVWLIGWQKGGSWNVQNRFT